MLDGQVPLIVDGRLHVLVPQAENASREAREIWTGETRRRRCNNALRRCRTRQRLQKVLRLEFATGAGAAVKRRIDRQAQVCSRPFQIVGDSESAANNGVTTKARRRPSKSQSRLEGLAAVNSAV